MYLDGIPVSDEIPNSLADGFWGLVSTVPFNAILLTAGTLEGNAETYVLDNMVYSGGIAVFTKDDNLDGQCTSPEQTITYTICFDNAFGQTIQDPFVLDWLPDGVDYDFILSLEPLVFDPNYNIEEHYYRWELDDIDPNEAACLELEVTVNYDAAPGGYLHNVAELWGTVMVTDPNDPNIVYPETRLVAVAVKDTRVCCYIPMPDELFVDKNAAGANNGLDWANAFLDLQSALEYARSQVCGEVQSIYCAQGIYSPGDDEGDSFILPENISLYGGFPTHGCDFSLRDPKKYISTLTGKIDDTHRNTTILTVADNVLIDGFTITESALDGQGIFGSGVDFSVVNSKIEKNLGYGAYIENGNATFRWCNFRNNEQDGIRHTGESFVLSLENCSVRQSGRYGIACADSTPSIVNSIIIESDLAQEGRAGLFMEDPTGIPYIQNCTIAHNKSAGLDLLGNRIPNIQNTIVYHNGGPAFAGFSADQAASYSCIADCNEVNGNINDDPQLAYFDPNNVRIRFDSPCHDTGFTLQENYSQVDMDNRTRVLGNDVDRGAYEIECDDTDNPLDWNSDGLINLYEFNYFSRAWMGHDPNDPAWLENSNLRDPNLSEGWYEWKYKCNLDATGDSMYSIDTADLIAFCEDDPQIWLWKACWLDLEELQMQQMTSGGGENILALNGTKGVEEVALSSAEGMAEVVIPAQRLVLAQAGTGIQSDSMAKPEALLVVEEKSVAEQVAELQDSIEFLGAIWTEDPDIQQEIDPNDWQQFMDSVSRSLLELQIEAVQIE